MGCIVYEMAALHSPFFGEKDNISSLVEKIQTADYPPLAEDHFSVQLVTLMDAMLNPMAVDRPNAREVYVISWEIYKRWQSVTNNRKRY